MEINVSVTTGIQCKTIGEPRGTVNCKNKKSIWNVR